MIVWWLAYQSRPPPEEQRTVRTLPSVTEDMAKGREYLEGAVASEPRHARAWVQLAEYDIHRSMGAGPPDRERPQALEAAQRAVATDSSLGAAHAALAFVRAFYQHGWTAALAQVEGAAHLPPTALYFLWAGGVYWSNERFAEAVRGLQQALQLDPLSVIAHHVLALFYNTSGRYDLALAHAQQG